MKKVIRLSDYYVKVDPASQSKVKDAIEMVLNESLVQSVLEVKGETYFIVEESEEDMAKKKGKKKKGY